MAGNGRRTKNNGRPSGVTAISVAGYKSIAREQSIEIKPLTVLAGTNSSGKTSIIEPLLLLKQTLEASVDPIGALKLDGPNVIFTTADQFLSRLGDRQASGFRVSLRLASGEVLGLFFKRKQGHGRLPGVELRKMTYARDGKEVEFRKGGDGKRILQELGLEFSLASLMKPRPEGSSVHQRRCFFYVAADRPESPFPLLDPAVPFANALTRMIDLPGFRDSDERFFKATKGGPAFTEFFDSHFAGVILGWQEAGNVVILGQLDKQLAGLGLASRVEARRLSTTQIDLRVSRMPVGGRGHDDLVSLSDVGTGVSQVLPVLVALLVAEPSQLVYVEQPEVHLHPGAESHLAEIFVQAARRGCRIIVETHSDLLLRGIQTLVTKGEIPAESVGLYWFSRSLKDGATRVIPGCLDKYGAYGDWPSDLDEVALNVENGYLDATSARHSK